MNENEANDNSKMMFQVGENKTTKLNQIINWL